MARLPLYDGLEMPSRYGWMADTDPKAFQALIEIRRNMTFDERFRQFLEMTEMVLRGYEDRVHRDYPQAVSVRSSLRAAALRLGNETVRRVYGWSSGDGKAS